MNVGVGTLDPDIRAPSALASVSPFLYAVDKTFSRDSRARR
jgi:hypothetical protein